MVKRREFLMGSAAAAAARRSASEKAVAEALVAKLEPLALSFTRKSGEEGRLFGSVTSADIATESPRPPPQAA